MTDWTNRQKNTQHTGYSPEKLNLPLELAWRHKMGYYVWTSPTIVDGIVYFAGREVLALELASGKTVWKNVSEEYILLDYNVPVYYEGHLLLNGTNGFYKVDAMTGEIINKLPYIGLNSSPVCVEDTIIFEHVGKKCVAVNFHTGEEKWSMPLEWMHYTPSIAGDLVYVPDSRSIHAVDWRTGEKKWEHTFEKGKVYDLAPVFDGIVVVSVKEYGVVALDALSGEERWRFPMQYGPFTAPSIGEDTKTVYVGGLQLHALNLESGKELWVSGKKGFIVSIPVIIGNHLFIGGGYDHAFYLYDRQTGELTWQYPTKDMVYSTAAYSDGHIVIGSHDGYLYCFRQSK